MTTIRFGREICGDLDAAASREWLCTNGAGSFAMGTVAGMPTRRYHGLLVAAMKPPLGRTTLATGVHEIVSYLRETHELATCTWADGTVAPLGHRLIERFELEGTTPTWTFALADALLTKRVVMAPGERTTCVRYEIERASAPLVLELRVLTTRRDFHSTSRGDSRIPRVEPITSGVAVSFDDAPPLLILCDRAVASSASDWYRGFRLDAEAERGLEDLDDAFHAATLRAELREGESLTLVLSAESQPSFDGDERRRAHESAVLARWRESGARGAWLPCAEQLVLAADQFVVRRPLRDDPEGRTIIAGYPWFGDWGRDTMIALPGLALVTGAPETSATILETFARFLDRGMLPNLFPDGGDAPEYNTVDATLWFVEAVRAHVDATGDVALLRRLVPALDEIVRWHVDGTRHGIGVDPRDGLLRSGEPGVQLTWMDAKVGDWVVTPRIGKCVEINALWHAALMSMTSFRELLGAPSRDLAERAARVRASFGRFWNEERGCLFDVIDGPEGDDASLRPNQILAVSLRDSPLDPSRRRRVLDVVSRHLLTSFGLRTLSRDDPAHRGRYEGGPVERDGAYHQGAAWAWLMGPFVEAHFRVHGDRDAARRLLAPFVDHVRDAGLGSISELFDSDPPHRARGCPWQAWSVAEVLRVAALLE